MPEFAPLVTANKNRPKDFQPLSSKAPSLPAAEMRMASGSKSGNPSTESGAEGKDKKNPNDNPGLKERIVEKDPKQLEVTGDCQDKKPVITLHRRASNPDEVIGMRVVCGCGEVIDVVFDYGPNAVPARGQVNHPEQPAAPEAAADHEVAQPNSLSRS
ncbi:MAG: hypothetical protein LR011_07425 [Verrucomicrobia bacterium]|nr:hypothetical protein [Verrucomicrobiota bacterium]